MPLYTVMTRAGALSGEAKAKLAGELTTLHSEYAGVPKNWVHIVSGLRTGKRFHGWGGVGDRGAHASCPNRPVAGIQA